MTAGAALGRFVAGLALRDVPAPLRDKAKDHLLDAIGVMCAGVAEPASRRLQKVVTRWGGVSEATVIGRSWRMAAPHAALLNAFHGRIHTYDDTYDVGPLHPGTPIVAAALAAGERSGASGADLLAGIISGFEVAVRLSAALGPSHYDSGFHNTGTCNAFGAAAAGARALGADPDTTAAAFGLAGGAAAGLRQYQIDGSMTDTALNGARAAEIGVVAAEMAAAGLAGPRGIIDGRYGVARTMASGADLGALTDRLGDNYRFAATAIKPYASCRFTHGPVEALIGLRRERFSAEDVESVTIAAFRDSVAVSGRPDPATRFDAILSHQYAAAVALQTGDIQLPDFTDAACADARRRALVSRVRVVHDPALDAGYPATWTHRVTVRLADGRMFEAVSDHPPGAAECPLPRARVVAKFRRLAAPVLGSASAAEAIDRVARFEDLPDLTPLMRLLRPAVEPTAVSRAVDAPRELAENFDRAK
ncbi:MAG: MmgE/PrpD family protein [Pseudomonadota bacterium]